MLLKLISIIQAYILCCILCYLELFKRMNFIEQIEGEETLNKYMGNEIQRQTSLIIISLLWIILVPISQRVGR